MQIIGHRGCGVLAAENTVEAVQKAVALGIDGTEIDVHLTEDNEVIVFHDDMIKGKLMRDCKVSEVKEFNLSIPFFGEVLKAVPKQFQLYVEVKSHYLSIKDTDTLVRSVLQLLKSYRKDRQSYVISFDERVMHYVKKYDPAISTFLLTENKRIHEIPRGLNWGPKFDSSNIELDISIETHE